MNGTEVDRIAIDTFLDELTEGASGYMVAAVRGVCRGDDGLDRTLIHLEWERASLLTEAVRQCSWRVARQAPAWRHARSHGFDHGDYIGVPSHPHFTDAETMIRPHVFATVPMDDDADKPRAGRADEVSAVLGIFSDLDVAAGRHDHRPYCPTIPMAMEFWQQDPVPTFGINTGKGVVALWQFTEPQTDIAAVLELEQDLFQHVLERCEDRGWKFDSPWPLIGWIKCPGTYSAIHDRIVRIAGRGQRWSFADLRAAIPEYEHRTPRTRDDHYGGGWGGGEMRWVNEASIPQLDDPGDEGNRQLRTRSPRGRRRRRT